MKKIMGLVILIVILALGGYYGTGLVTQRTIQKNVEIINQSNGLMVDVAGYDRGWFVSHAELDWRVHIPERVIKNANGDTTTVPAQDFIVKTPLTIYHGPIIFSDNGVKFGLGYAHTEVDLPQAYLDKFNALFTDASIKPKLDLSLFVNYLNNSRLHIAMPPFTLISKQGGDEFKWQGIDANFSISSNLSSVSGDMTLTGLQLSQDKVLATLGKTSSNYALHQTDVGIYLGDAHLSLPSFVVVDNGKKALEVEQLAIDSSSGIEKGLFDSTLNVSLRKIMVQDKVYGPAQLDMSLKNLDAKILGDINSQANQIQQASVVDRQKALIALLPELPKLFAQGATFEISKLSLVVPEGNIDGNLLISLPKGNSNNPFQLLQKVEGHGKIKVPAAMLKEMMVATMRQKLLSQQQPTLSEAMAKQIKDSGVAPAAANETANVTAAPTTDTASAPVEGGDANTAASAATSQPVESKPLTAAELEQQAIAQAEQKLTTMVQSGLLVLQNNEYVIKVELLQGQLSVNDKPFNSAMMQF